MEIIIGVAIGSGVTCVALWLTGRLDRVTALALSPEASAEVRLLEDENLRLREMLRVTRTTLEQARSWIETRRVADRAAERAAWEDEQRAQVIGGMEVAGRD